VKFLIDANGILKVSAREQRSGQEAQIDVKPTYGLTDEQVESMILDSFDHAEDDLTERQLIEARNEANTILEAVEKGRQHAAWQQLTLDEVEAIAAGTTLVQNAANGTDYKAIREAIDTLDKATRRFAEVMMDSAVTGAMRGQTMGQAGEHMGQNLGAAPSAPHAFAPAEIEDEDSLETIEEDPETPGESPED
jgi:molecular chaperone DnaK